MIPISNNPHITRLYTVFRRDCPESFFFSGETHDFYELVCVLDGQAGVTADHRVFELSTGQAILHPPMQFHNIYSIGGTSPIIAVFTFSGTDIPKIENSVLETGDISQVKELLSIAEQSLIINKFHIDNIASEKHLQYVKQLELLLLKLSHRDKEQPLSQRARNYAVIMKTLKSNLDKRLSVKDIADLCKMSEINLQKTFSKYAGVSVMEYYNRAKMQKAVFLLKEGRSVKETALLLGYTDQNYFSTAFKRIIGKPPTSI